jgi:hypothetical protein
MQPLQNRKDVQKLTDRIASLKRFISKLAEQSIPFFTIFRSSAKIDWGTQQQQAFDDLKNYLEHLPTLSSPKQGQPSYYTSRPGTQQLAQPWLSRRKSHTRINQRSSSSWCISCGRSTPDLRSSIPRWKKFATWSS